MMKNILTYTNDKGKVLFLSEKGVLYNHVEYIPKLPLDILIKEIPKYLDGKDLFNYIYINKVYIMNKINDNILLKISKYDPSMLIHIKRVLSNELQEQLYKINNKCIKYIKEPNINIQYLHVNKWTDSQYVKRNNWTNIQDIKNPSLLIQHYCIEFNPKSLFLIKNPDEELQLKALKLNRHLIKRFHRNKIYPTDEFYCKAIKNDHKIFELINNPSDIVKSFVNNLNI
jgi:hypothetical protein